MTSEEFLTDAEKAGPSLDATVANENVPANDSLEGFVEMAKNSRPKSEVKRLRKTSKKPWH